MDQLIKLNKQSDFQRIRRFEAMHYFKLNFTGEKINSGWFWNKEIILQINFEPIKLK